MGNGQQTKFWVHPWVEGGELRTEFNRLYRISTNKDGTVAAMGGWYDGRWVWDWHWRRELFLREIDLLQQLEVVVVGQCNMQDHTSDKWVWKEDQSGLYTVRSAYKALRYHDAVLMKVWNKRVPLKVASFVWKLMQNRVRVPTKDNLVRRGIIVDDNRGC